MSNSSLAYVRLSNEGWSGFDSGGPPRAAQLRLSGAFRTRRIVGLAYPGAQLLDLAAPLEVFSLAAELMRRETGAETPLYRVEIWADRKGAVRTMSSIGVAPTGTIGDSLDDVDTIHIPGVASGFPEIWRSQRILSWLREAAQTVRRIASGCSGAYLLAEAGLLNGRRVAAHWRDAEMFRHLYSAAAVVKDATFVRDGPIYTSAGAAAAIDMALAMIEEDFGRALSLEIAKSLVLFLKRPGEQSQFSTILASQARSVRFGDLIDWIHRSLRADLSASRLAERAAMSTRNFTRVFSKELGVGPAAFVRAARVDVASRLIATGSETLGAIARECGFASEKQMGRAFQAALRMSPRQYAERVRRVPNRKGTQTQRRAP